MKFFLKIFSLVIGLLFIFSAVKAASADDIAKQITQLQQQIAELQRQLSLLQLAKILSTVVLEKDLRFGQLSDDIAFTQRILKEEGLFCKSCYITGYFGVGTRNAILSFQKQNDLSQTGFVDSATREKLNKILQESRSVAGISAKEPTRALTPTPFPASAPVPVSTLVPTPAPPANSSPAVSSGQGVVASIRINNGATVTGNSKVTLALTCSAAEGVKDVRYTDNMAFTVERFEPFSPIKDWTLSGNSGKKTVTYQCEDVVGHRATTSANIIYDASPPERSGAQPSSALAAGTTQTTLSLQTDEDATCKYSATPNQPYDAMQNTFATTGGTSHITTISGLYNGGQYVYYVKCKDALSNENFNDFQIGFRVISPTYAMNVLVLKYFPLTQDGKNIDINVTGDVGDSLQTIRQKTIDITNNLVTDLQKASTYLGYRNMASQPSLRYSVVDTKEYIQAIPTKDTPVLRYPDYYQILSSVRVCDYVDQQNVSEVWLFAYQGPNKADGAPYLNISESKMEGQWGDISNSLRYNDMPLCHKTYRLYTFNYGRGTTEAFESWSHQMEAELEAVNSTLFRNIFQGVNYPQTLDVPGRCGSVHNPPNARYEYDRANPNSQASDCLRWNPDTLGPISPVSCQSWGCQDNSDNDNPSLNYMIWNWQNLPGLDNTKSYTEKHLRNWWDVHGDFDNVIENRRRLTIEP